MNIHEARKLGSVRLAEREVEATSRRVPRTDKSFLYPGAPHLVRVRRRVRPPDRKNWVLVQNEYSYADE